MKNTIYILILLLLCLGCSNNDDSSDSQINPSNVFIKANVNGSPIMINDEAEDSDLRAYFSLYDGGFYFTVGGSRVDETFTNEGLGVVVFGDDFDDVVAGYEVEFDSNLLYRFTGYYTNNAPFEEPFPELVLTSGVFRVGSIDKNAQIISGTFSFSGALLGSGNTYAITNGQFQNIPYDVLD